MSFVSLLHIGAFFFYAWAMIFILNHKPLTRSRILGAGLFFAFLIWSLSYGLMYFAYQESQVLFLANFSALGWCTYPFLGLWFYLDFTGHKRITNNKLYLALLALPGLFFIYQQWSGNLVNEVLVGRYGWVIDWELNWLTYAYVVYCLVMNFISMALCFRIQGSKKSRRQQKQILLLISTALVSIVLGFVTDDLLPFLNIDAVPEIADVLIVIWGIGVILAITKYGLLGLTPSIAADTIINTMDDSLMLVDKSGVIVLVNEATKKLFTDQTNLVGSKFSGVVTDPVRAEEFLNNAFEQRGKAKTELIYRVSSGQKLMDISSSIIGSKMESALGLVIVARDMTAKKKSEEEIKEQRNLINEILETVPNSVLLVDSNLKIIKANKAFLEIFKLTENVAQNISLDSIIISGEFLKNTNAVLCDEKPGCYFEFRHKTDGLEKIFIANITGMGKKRALIILNDITMEREKQEKLYLADRLATVGEMVSGVAHELNNPLTSMIALSRMLLDQDLPNDVHDDVGYIHSEAQRAAAIVRNMQTFARKHASVLQSTPVNKILEDVIKVRAYEHKINNITVQAQLDNDLPEIMANYFQIQQVFLNIILNAESAVMDTKVKDRLLTIATGRRNNHIWISFTDTGPGIPVEMLDRVFDPFFTTKEVGKGTGLGLSICYGIINAHKGKIYARNEQGKGVTFVIELPIQSCPESGEESELHGSVSNNVFSVPGGSD